MTKRIFYGFLFCSLFFSACALSQAIPVSGYKLAWQDEFNGDNLDLQKWNHRGLGKRGDAFNDQTAVSLNKKGHLIIEARLSGTQLITGMISTENIFETRYGYFECRAKLTELPGLWPAFWLQSKHNGDNGTPANQGVEIDIFEYFPHSFKDSVSHSLHWGGYGNTHQVFGPFYSLLKKTDDGFHVFGLEWTENSYTIYVDGQKTQEGNSHISKQPEFIILSLEANKAVAGPVDFAKLPARFTVDYVRVYKRIEK